MGASSVVDRAATVSFQLLREVFALARTQREALERDDLAHYDALLDDREVLMRRLQQLRAESLDPAELPANVIPFPGVAVLDEEDVLAIDTLIRGILEHDRGNEELLRGRRAAMLRDLPALDAGRRSLHGYRATAAGDARFVDRAS